MSRTHDHDTSFDEFDELRDPPPRRTDFDRIAERMVSRRALLGGGDSVPRSAVIAINREDGGLIG